MKLELYDFQRRDVDRFKEEKQAAGLFAYEQALGKTLTATTLGMELGLDVNLVIAPQVTFDGWEEAVHTQSDGTKELKWIKGTKKGLEVLDDFYNGVPGWYFTTWQFMRGGSLHDTEADLVIGDEIQEIQNAGGSAQNILISKIKSQKRIALSGTAAGNKLEGMFGIISWLWPSRYRSYWKWLKANFYLQGVGYAQTPIMELRPGIVTDDMPFYVRRLKKNHYAEMIPAPCATVEIFVELTAVQRRIYDEFVLTSGAWLDEEDEDAGFAFAQYGITKAMRLREIALANPVMEIIEDKYTPVFRTDAESAKLDELVKLVTSDEHKDETFVVYTHSKKFIEVVVNRLEENGVTARAFSGDLTYAKKRKAISELGSKFRVLVATQASIGTGTDGLQHKSSRLVILSRSVKMTENLQAQERLYRPGQKEHVQTWEIIARNTNDLDTNETLDYAEKQVASMLDANTES